MGGSRSGLIPPTRCRRGANVQDHEPSFWADDGPRYSHAPPGSGAHEIADHLIVSGTEPGDPRMKAAANWRRGAIGEQEVGRRLDQLPRRHWAVVHDLTIGSGGANLDHLVIGPPRAFTVNTKHLSGDVVVYKRALLVAGRKTPYLPKAVKEASRVRRRLGEVTGIDAFVWPVLVFHGCRVSIKEHPDDVTILQSSEVPTWFAQQRHRTLSAANVMTLETAARATTTWPSTNATPESQAERLAERAQRRTERQGQEQPTHTVARWRRFGNDRWYVNDGDGDSMGYYDAIKDVVVSERAEDDALVRAALRREDIIP